MAAILPREWGAAYRAPEQIAAERDRRLRETVRYAAATVPWYRRLFAEMGVDPREIRAAADLERLPIIDRATVQRRPDDFLSDSRRARGAMAFPTSGSTGEPLTVWHDPTSMAANVGYSVRERRALMRYTGRAYRYRQLSVRRVGGTVQRIGATARERAFIPLRPPRLIVPSSAGLEEVVTAINSFQPDLLRSYGTLLESFYRTVVARDIPLHRPRLVVFGADGLSPQGRRLIRETLGIPVIGIYGTVEVFKIAFQCGEGTHYHLHEDLAHVRVVDREGRTLPPGRRGEVVVSDLVNRAMVLLNYRLGDVSMRLDERCPCGMTLPLLGDVEGRLEDILTLPDGSRLNPRDVWAVLAPEPGLLRYQLVQRRGHRFELRLVTVDDEAWASATATLPAALGPRLKGAVLELTRHESLSPDPSGKFRLVVAASRTGEPDA